MKLAIYTIRRISREVFKRKSTWFALYDITHAWFWTDRIFREQYGRKRSTVLFLMCGKIWPNSTTASKLRRLEIVLFHFDHNYVRLSIIRLNRKRRTIPRCSVERMKLKMKKYTDKYVRKYGSRFQERSEYTCARAHNILESQLLFA